MYYIGKAKQIVEQLPSYYDGMSKEELKFREVMPFEDKGVTKELPIKGRISLVEDTYVQLYVSEDDFLKRKAVLVEKLKYSYEIKVDMVVRKSTQDLAFGDIKVLPKRVIDKRETLKEEYHKKAAAIKATVDIAELNALVV